MYLWYDDESFFLGYSWFSTFILSPNETDPKLWYGVSMLVTLIFAFDNIVILRVRVKREKQIFRNFVLLSKIASIACMLVWLGFMGNVSTYQCPLTSYNTMYIITGYILPFFCITTVTWSKVYIFSIWKTITQNWWISFSDKNILMSFWQRMNWLEYVRNS